MLRGLFSSVVMGSGLIAATSAMAAPDYEITHTGDNNPQTENWRAIDIVASTVTEFSLPRVDVGPVDDNGTLAWKIADPNANETSAYWAKDLPGGSTILTSYWKFSANLRALPSNGGAGAPLNSAMRLIAHSNFAFGTGYGSMWQVTFEDLVVGGTRIRIDGDNGIPYGSLLNPVDITVSDGYHQIDLLYNPGTGAYFYVDGQLIQSNVSHYQKLNSGNRVEFGDLIMVNSGVGGGNWASVYFGVDDAQAFTVTTVPEPQTWALLLAGLGLVYLGSRARKSV